MAGKSAILQGERCHRSEQSFPFCYIRRSIPRAGFLIKRWCQASLKASFDGSENEARHSQKEPLRSAPASKCALCRCRMVGQGRQQRLHREERCWLEGPTGPCIVGCTGEVVYIGGPLRNVISWEFWKKAEKISLFYL